MSQLSINTTQNVTINFNTASVGSRILAYLLDILIIFAYYIVIYLIIGKLLDAAKLLDNLDRWTEIGIHSIIALPALFYALVQESLLEGQTVGKKLMKIKVIKIDGYQAGFGDYLIRWLFRIVEVTGIFGIVGLISLMVTKKTQRLGDITAGTAVISLKNDISIDHTILKDISNSYVPVYPLVIKLTDNDVRIIKETYDAAYKSADFNMIQKLQDKIETVTGIKSVSQGPLAFVDTVLADYNYYTQNM
ncbi:RDD family protein [Flavobacterium sp. Sd200]|uniref:RDD family protein n=1 Tax=Flavobacterium sp. Sd200 TaxID=2692211 RepID=UPI001368CDD0|nr:RDD family protein [Flavobacterium sp. Sd200]MXN90438.1 RDD family protein [Flavobacterium sp. Sd200]